MNAIEIKNVSKKYSGFHLDNISFQLPKGYIMGLVGENGAGKSTAIKLIMNAIKADSGTINVMGEKNTAPGFVNIKQDIGVVLDETGFPELLSAHDIEKVMGKIYTNWDKDVFYAHLQKMSVPPKQVFKTLSRGMKMKLAIAVALSHKAKLLVLDEATSGLDPMVRNELLDVLSEFTRDENNSILLSSHIVSDLEKICDYIAFLHKGKLILCEEKDVLMEKYTMLKLTDEDIEVLAEEAIVRKRKTAYGWDVLAIKEEVPGVFQKEYITLEDIIIFLSKEA